MAARSWRRARPSSRSSSDPDPDRGQPGAWRGVKVREGGRLRLAHCDIGYAGDDGSGLRIESNDVQARNCRIHHTQGDGILLWGGGGFTAVLDPVVRPLSSLDPLTSTLGWDGGMLTPGQVYRRQFMTEGRYSYTDGAGHVGVVVVRGPRLYLPLVRRN